MCLITKQKEPIILKEDLVVYKVLDKDLKSAMQEFQYAFNTLYEAEIEESENPCFAGSYDRKYYGKGLILLNLVGPNTITDKSFIAYGRGIHFASSIERANIYKNEIYYGARFVIVECLIPAGSEVYYDETGLGITNQLTVVKKIIS